MPITTITTLSDGSLLVDVSVSVDGLTVDTEEATVRWGDDDYSLGSFSSDVTPDATDPTLVCGYLVYDTVAEEMAVLIDEVVADDVDVPYEFSGSPYTVITTLFSFTLPAEATSLDGVDIAVCKIEEAAKPDLQVAQEGQMADRATLLENAEAETAAREVEAAAEAAAIAAAEAAKASVLAGGES
jgi:hypothetical protein